jgi:KipI family sensor histidine kinase inhibitor
MRLLELGDTGLLVELPDLDAVLDLLAGLTRDLAERDGGRDGGPNGGAGPASVSAPEVVDLVPAERTLLVRFDPARADPARVRDWVTGTRPARRAAAATERVELPVRYDGQDLDDVGRLTGLGPDGVVAAHTGRDWTVAFTGFAPGFGYLVGGDPRLRVPRLAESRVRVPAGSVALAGDYSGVYPRPSPGGWRLIGRTDVAVWDLDRDPPALLRPGVAVRFVAIYR